ncbi:MAG: 4Fe-4S dicluster domain-containing protein [Coriobacteriia bacterium]|nr:4Fe-4S dicluster domain-containing protein [Coriobacteriia bacterium]
MNITFKKYDPAVDAAPYEVTCEVEHWDKMTVLEAISWANENREPIAFDYSCRGRVCGRCAVMLDGNPILACVTMIGDASHKIEPLVGQPVLHDLIVDKSQAQARIAQKYARVRTSPLKKEEINTYDMTVAEKIKALEWCARCQVCTAACPAHAAAPSKYVGPASMLATAFRFYDPYDQADRVVEAVQEGLWACIMCGKCDQVCPQGEIKHLDYWTDLRAAATARGFTAPKA